MAGPGAWVHIYRQEWGRQVIAQIGIMVFGCSAIWLIGRKESWSRWGFVMGLLSQPFWFWSAYQAEQWGIFLVCCWYLYSWVQGFYYHFLCQSGE